MICFNIMIKIIVKRSGMKIVKMLNWDDYYEFDDYYEIRVLEIMKIFNLLI